MWPYGLSLCMFLAAKVPKVSFHFTVVWPLSWTNLEVHLGAWVSIGESQKETFKKCGPVRCLLMVEGRSLKGLVGNSFSFASWWCSEWFCSGMMCCLATCPMAWNQMTMDWKLQNCEQTPNFMFISWSSLVLCYSDEADQHNVVPACLHTHPPCLRLCILYLTPGTGGLCSWHRWVLRK